MGSGGGGAREGGVVWGLLCYEVVEVGRWKVGRVVLCCALRSVTKPSFAPSAGDLIPAFDGALGSGGRFDLLQDRNSGQALCLA